MQTLPLEIMLPVHVIHLPGGVFAIIDLDDSPLVGDRGFHLIKSKHKTYVRSNKLVGHKAVMLHTLITGWSRTDHVNGNPLDCRKFNLRPATHKQNMANQQLRRTSTSGFKGVSRFGEKWKANIGSNANRVHLGLFTSAEDAARAYDTAAIERYGEYANTNQMMGLLT